MARSECSTGRQLQLPLHTQSTTVSSTSAIGTALETDSERGAAWPGCDYSGAQARMRGLRADLPRALMIAVMGEV
jgi:hypothetical protein